MAIECPAVSEILVRVNYSETDQMGVVYHARYLVWLDMARTEHLRQCGMSYRDLEAEDARLLATATTSLLALDSTLALSRLPDRVRDVLTMATDPVKIG
jgi:acyl-CoA thioesterase FadM